MKQRTFVQIVASIVVLVFAIGIWSTGGQVDVAWLRFFSAAVTAAVVVLWLWDRILWKSPLAQRLRAAPRDISGTWRGTLTSLWDDPSTGESSAPKTVYLVVRQTASTASIILFTDQSRSVSCLAVVSTGEGTTSLDYLYAGTPDSRFEDRSRAHRGTASLNITGLRPTRLRGRYWTDRDSRGELDFTDRRKYVAEDFEEAARQFEAGDGSKI